MEELLVPVLVGFTSLAAYMIGTRALGLSSGGIGQAVGKMLEALGTALVFVIVNLVTGIIGVLAARAVTGEFVSLYLAADPTLLPLSLLQGLTFQWWRELSPQGVRGRGEGGMQ